MPIKLKLAALALGGILACGVGKAGAATVSLSTDSSNTAITSGLVSSVTTGAQMNGMEVTAHFLDSSSETLIWAANGRIRGGVSSDLFSLRTVGDTYHSKWKLSTSSSSALAYLSIDAGEGGAVFDIFNGGFGTPGSDRGRAFTDLSRNVIGSVLAHYAVAVGLEGSEPNGDLFAKLLIDFTELNGGGLTGKYKFGADTDNLRIKGDLSPTPVPAPIAGAGLPVLLALGGVVWAGRRKAAVAA